MTEQGFANTMWHYKHKTPAVGSSMPIVKWYMYMTFGEYDQMTPV